MYNCDFLRHCIPFPTTFTTERAYGLERRVALRRPPQNRLEIGVRREGAVLLETWRLTRTDGWDPASICLGARRGGYIV